MERYYYLGFSCFSGIGPVKFSALIKKFETAKNAWNASVQDLKEILGEAGIVKFEKFRVNFDCKKYVEKLKQEAELLFPKFHWESHRVKVYFRLEIELLPVFRLVF